MCRHFSVNIFQFYFSLIIKCWFVHECVRYIIHIQSMSLHKRPQTSGDFEDSEKVQNPTLVAQLICGSYVWFIVKNIKLTMNLWTVEYDTLNFIYEACSHIKLPYSFIAICKVCCKTISVLAGNEPILHNETARQSSIQPLAVNNL